MFRTGPRNLITDVAGLRVGNAADARLKSGVTAVLCDEPAVAGVQVLGGAPGTRETDLLEPHNSVEAIHAVVLSGGSAFGLDAASGVQAALRERRHRLRGRRLSRADRAGGDPVRPAQWRRQGLGPLSALPRARLRSRPGRRGRLCPRHGRRRHRRADVRPEGRARLGFDCCSTAASPSARSPPSTRPAR